jgi:hypothetical protein
VAFVGRWAGAEGAAAFVRGRLLAVGAAGAAVLGGAWAAARAICEDRVVSIDTAKCNWGHGKKIIMASPCRY